MKRQKIYWNIIVQNNIFYCFDRPIRASHLNNESTFNGNRNRLRRSLKVLIISASEQRSLFFSAGNISRKVPHNGAPD